MNIALLQFWDEWLGRLFCFIFTQIRRVIDFFGTDTKTPPNKILFVKLVEKGATVLAYSAFQRAIERVGKDNVYLLVFTDNVDIAKALKLFKEDNILTISNNSLVSAIIDILKTLVAVRQKKIDAVIDLEFFSKMTAAFCFLLGARIRVGLHPFNGGGPYRGNLFTHRLIYSIDLHCRQIFETMVEALGADPDQLPAINFAPPAKPPYSPVYDINDDARANVKKRILNFTDAEKNRPLILLNPYVSDELPFRRWPSERYVVLAGKLLQQYPEAQLVLVGTKRDLEPNEQLLKAIGDKRVFNIGGQTSLEDLLVVFDLADLLITSDGGASHLASLCDIEVITMFGPETPRLFAAETERNHVIYKNLACSPALNAFNNRKYPLPKAVDMDAITVEEVYDLAVDILSRSNVTS